jgi:hypothetical protein
MTTRRSLGTFVTKRAKSSASPLRRWVVHSKTKMSPSTDSTSSEKLNGEVGSGGP